MVCIGYGRDAPAVTYEVIVTIVSIIIGATIFMNVQVGPSVRLPDATLRSEPGISHARMHCTPGNDGTLQPVGCRV